MSPEKAKLNKYESEEQILMKNIIKIKHDIREPSNKVIDCHLKNSAPRKLQNF